MKVVELIHTKPTPFRGRIPLGPLGGTSSSGDIVTSTFVKLRDWILIEHKD
jgi:hypothetical protein